MTEKKIICPNCSKDKAKVQKTIKLCHCPLCDANFKVVTSENGNRAANSK